MSRSPHQIPVVTSDGLIHDIKDIGFTEKLRKPNVLAEVHFQIQSDLALALARMHGDNGTLKNFFIGRSGHSRIGLHPQIEKEADMIIEGNRLIVEARIYSLRDATNDKLLSVLGKMFESKGPGKIELGRLFLPEPDSALTAEEIQQAIDQHTLMLPETASITDDGLIELSLEDMHYFISEATFNEENMERALMYGKHAMDEFQDWKEGFPNKEKLTKNRFFLGAVRIALGPFTAIIEENTSQTGVKHLAARMLDGVRTTGLILPKHARQVELFKEHNEALDPKLKIRIRLYHANGKMKEISDEVINERTLFHGVSFRDITKMNSQDRTFPRLMESISESYLKNTPFGLILARGKAGEIDWEKTSRIQESLTDLRVTEVISSTEGRFLSGKQIPQDARELTEALRFVGGTQTHGKILISAAFPSKRLREGLFSKGVGIYVAKHLQQDPQAFGDETCSYGFTSTYFTGETYPDFRQAERDGVQFFMIFPETSITSNGTDYHNPEEVRAFYKGFWVRPEDCEKMDQIDTVIAMYGSHKDEIIPHLQGQMESFMARMKAKLGDKVAITHGNGPGAMFAADQAAAKHDVFRLGVSIAVEKFGQDENPTPPARVGFKDQDRLTRQNLLDDISNFTLFNIGGAGTLEEIAITICSQKLRKNIITPIIFVDPFGLGKEGSHIWTELEQLIQTLAEKKEISASEAAEGLSNLQLLQAYAPNFCHLVNSYDEAAEILEDFIDDPIAYYHRQGIPANEALESFEQSRQIFEKTGFKAPHWAKKEDYEAFAEKK